jgi:ribonuclease HII
MNRQEEYNFTTTLLGHQSNKKQQAHLFIIGCDEAGRGPLAGPVVASACCLNFVNDDANTSKTQLTKPLPGLLSKLGDSKKIPEKIRDQLYVELERQKKESEATAKKIDSQHQCLAFDSCRVEPEEIDDLNILEASLHGMERAADGVLSQLQKLHKKGQLSHAPNEDNCVVLIDGPHLPRFYRSNNENDNHKKKVAKKDDKVSAAKPKKLTPKAEKELEARNKILQKNFTSIDFVPKAKAVIKGDAICASISAASIVAKVERDKIMNSEVAPKADKLYNLAQNKGYPTAEHIAALEKIGASKFHRKSYGPVKTAIEKFEAKAKKKAKKEIVEKTKKATKKK